MTKKSVYLFNPTCELAVANGSFSYLPPLLLQQMEGDLAILPFVMANENDFVLTENKPTQKFIEKLTDAGFKIPRFCSLSELENAELPDFDAIRPWGWSPAAHHKLRNLKEKCTSDFRNSPVFNWIPRHQSLYERQTALKLLAELLENDPSEYFIEKDWIGKIVTGAEEINEILFRFGAVVVKAPLSSSGRGIQIIRRKTLKQPHKEWISGVLKQQKYIVAEPWLDKLLDVSFQFQVDSKTGLNYLGHTFFETNSNGQYQSTFIGANLKKLIPDVEETELEEIIRTTAIKLKMALQNSDYTLFYEGFLGVDALIFRSGGRLKIQPCIEVNCRMNMGILALNCERQMQPNSPGKLSIYYNKGLNFSEFSEKMEKEFSPIIIDGRLVSGYFPLTEPLPGHKFGAYLYLGDSR